AFRPVARRQGRHDRQHVLRGCRQPRIAGAAGQSDLGGNARLHEEVPGNPLKQRPIPAAAEPRKGSLTSGGSGGAPALPPPGFAPPHGPPCRPPRRSRGAGGGRGPPPAPENAPPRDANPPIWAPCSRLTLPPIIIPPRRSRRGPSASCRSAAPRRSSIPSAS